MLEKETDNSGGVNMDHSEKLEKLQQLLDGGIITQEEFDAKKEQIMKQTEAVVEEVEVVEFAVADNEASTAAPVLQGTADDDLQSKRAALIGKNAEHYLPIFEKLDQSGGSSWDWCGFFFAPFWFAYRKVYGWVAIAMIVPLLLGIVVGIFVYSSSADDAIANVIIRVSSLAVILFVFYSVVLIAHGRETAQLEYVAPATPIIAQATEISVNADSIPAYAKPTNTNEDPAHQIPAESLKVLKELHDTGVLSEEEFAEKKRQLLGL